MRPLIPITLAFILGVFSGGEAEPTYGFAIFLVVATLVPLVIGFLTRGPFRTVLVLPCFFSIGMLFILPLARPEIPANHIKNFAKGTKLLVEGVVSGPVEERPGGGKRVYIDTTRVFIDSNAGPDAKPGADGVAKTGVTPRPVTGRVMLSVRGNASVFEGLAGLSELASGDTVRFRSRLKEPRNFGNPGGFDYVWWLKRKGVLVTASVREGGIVKVLAGKVKRVDALRANLGRFVDSSGTENPGLIKALIIGERGAVSKETREVFARAGTAHLLAISGLHVGFVAYFFYVPLLWAFKRSEHLMLALDVKKLAIGLAMAPVVFYGMLAAFPVSTQRAVIMVGVFAFMLLMARARYLYGTLALAALVVVLADPGSPWEASFHLSFVAVFFIIHLVPGLKGVFEGKVEESEEVEGKGYHPFILYFTGKTRTMLLVTLAATAGTLPLVAMHFNLVSLASLVSNLVCVPLTGFVVVPLLFLTAIFMPFSEALASMLLGLADVSISVVVRLAEFFASLPGASFRVSTPTPVEVAVFLAILFCLPYVKSRRVSHGVLPALVLLLIVDLGYYGFRDRRSHTLDVTFISVGQGDASLVEFPIGPLGGGGGGGAGPRKRMLIDGGGLYSKNFDIGEMVVAPFLWGKKIKRLDYLVLSHAQRDHMGGLSFIARNFSPLEFWWNGIGELDLELAEALEKGGARVRVFDASSSAVEVGGAIVEFLNPSPRSLQAPRPTRGSDEPDINESSLVMRVAYGKRAFLFTGDIGKGTEEALLQSPLKSKLVSDVLKVGHHGSRTSSSSEFIEAVSPGLAVASVGWMNPFGFPHEETLESFVGSDIRLLRTDIDGAISVSTDGELFRVSTKLTKNEE